MSIPPNLQVKLRAGSAVVKCDSCQRILYYAE
jgi:predicted  nucleic acid-binding Zn-ribbon protein